MKMVEVRASIDDIPEDILLQIFYKSPLESLIRFSCVSKLWFNLTNNDQEQFSKFHFLESQKKPTLIFTFQYKYDVQKFYNLEKDEHGNDHKILPYRKKEVQNKYVFGEVNGLVLYWDLCQFHWVHFSLEICNPSRLEKLTIVSRLDGRAGQHIFRFLFGYNLFNNEYKVICITKSYEEGYNYYYYYVLTLGSSQPWRQIHNPWPKQHPERFFECPGRKRVPPISCNGTLFYEMKKDERVSLVSFDLQVEKFQIIKFPSDDEEFTNLYPLEPLEYKGCLCYTRMEKINPYQGKLALYILKDTISQVWVKETVKFNLPRKLDNPAPPATTRVMNFSNQVIMYWCLYNKEDNDYGIQYYNVHLEEFEEVKIPSNDGYESYDGRLDHRISSHIENFISLKTLAVATEDEGHTREAVEAYKKNKGPVQQLFSGIPKNNNPAVISFVGRF